MPIRALIVDDSAFARKVIREILEASQQIDVVGSARNGEEALAMVEEMRPDIVICDLQMPKVDGVEFVKRQMIARPIPILILSAAASDAAEVIEALNAGAMDVVKKPSALAVDELRSVREELVEKIRAVAKTAPKSLVPAAQQPFPVLPVPVATKASIVVIGISTGGPQALRRILPQFPAGFPVPIAIVLHMPVGYTAMFAEKLSEKCQIAVKEAREGDLFKPGSALIAPAGRHLSIKAVSPGKFAAQLSVRPLEKIHRPSADVLFQSAAGVFRERVLAVVMTGMGDDGKEGCAWVKSQGGTVITEDEKSCVIYGMPRAVVEAGLSDAAIPLEEMAEAITARL